MDAPIPQPPGAGRVILGSLLSALAGWLTLAVVPLTAYFLRTDDGSGIELSSFLVLPIYAFYFVLPVWFVALLPLYCLVPPGSVLWRWPVCTLCGAVAGGAIILAFCALLSGGLTEGWPLAGLAALVGAATCLFGSLSRRWFRFPART